MEPQEGPGAAQTPSLSTLSAPKVQTTAGRADHSGSKGPWGQVFRRKGDISA